MATYPHVDKVASMFGKLNVVTYHVTSVYIWSCIVLFVKIIYIATYITILNLCFYVLPESDEKASGAYTFARAHASIL